MGEAEQDFQDAAQGRTLPAGHGWVQIVLGHEMSVLQRTEDGIAFEDGVMTLRDGREMAWRWWGEPGGAPVLRIQGTPGSRLSRNPDPSVQLGLGVRYLMADRAGYGGSARQARGGNAGLWERPPASRAAARPR